MRVFRCLAAAALAASLLAEPAAAQMRPPILYPPPGAGMKLRQPPMLPPSGAVNRARMNNPGARVIGVVPNGAGYNVRLKQGNRIFLYPVNPGN